ncbi:MAG: hypothetical protein ACR2HR_03925 [Euzebya sp.]
MTALSAGGWTDDPEALARRALGLQAAWCAAVGTGAVLFGGGIARAVRLPSSVVRVGGLASIGWSATVALWSLAEEWKPATRRVTGANVVAASALTGHALARGTAAGRVGIGLTAAQLAGFAFTQAKALVAAEPERRFALQNARTGSGR